MSTDTQRKKNLRNLEEKLIKTEKKVEEYDLRYQQANRILAQLKNGIHSIFSRIGASATQTNAVPGNASTSTKSTTNAVYDEILGNQGVTESNMMQYLGLIVQRTAEILQSYAVSQAQLAGVTNEYSLQLPVIVQADPAMKFIVQPPSYDDMSSDDDSENEQDERPLTRQELEKRTAKEIARKAGILNQN